MAFANACAWDEASPDPMEVSRESGAWQVKGLEMAHGESAIPMQARGDPWAWPWSYRGYGMVVIMDGTVLTTNVIVIEGMC